MTDKQTTAVATQQDPRAAFVQQIETKLRPEISKVLPPDIPVEKFERVVQTAVMHNPELLTADRGSLFTACIQAANDGLEPDGKDGALICYSNKDKKTNVWTKAVRWTPMIRGIYKKLRQNPDVAGAYADVVYETDEFSFERGDEERLFHRPNIFSQNRGQPIGAYAVVTLKDGTKEREVMSLADIQQVQECSKSQSGPWKEWWGQMAKKSVMHRLAKRLPLNEATRLTLDRDDDLYDFGRAPQGDPPSRPTRQVKSQAYRAIEGPGQMPDTPEERGEAPEEPADEEEKEEDPEAAAAETAAPEGNGFVEDMLQKFRGIGTLEGLETAWAKEIDEINLLGTTDYNRLDKAYSSRSAELRDQNAKSNA